MQLDGFHNGAIQLMISETTFWKFPLVMTSIFQIRDIK